MSETESKNKDATLTSEVEPKTSIVCLKGGGFLFPEILIFSQISKCL